MAKLSKTMKASTTFFIAEMLLCQQEATRTTKNRNADIFVDIKLENVPSFCFSLHFLLSQYPAGL